MPTEEERALYGLMAVAEETTKLAQSTIRELPTELTRQLVPRLEEIEKSTASARAALVAFPRVVEEAEKRVRSTGTRLALYGGGVCLAVATVVALGLWWWQSNLLNERAELHTEIVRLKAAIQAEEVTLTKMKSKTWGIKLHEDKNGRFIILPEKMKLDPMWTLENRSAAKLIPQN